MRNWLKWIRISFGVAAMLALLGLAQSQSIKLSDVPVVEWNQNDSLELIDYQTVLSWTSGFLPKGNSWPQIDSMEERLGRHPSVFHVEASVSVNGKIRIQIDQRDPLLRLIDSLGHQRYLDKEDQLMPALVGIPARTPVVTGLSDLDGTASDSLFISELSILAKALYSDPFWWNFSDQISVKPGQGFVMSPKIGQHQIVLGTASNLNGKLKKLKLFYQHGLHSSDWNSYSIIDARYKGQIVCQPTFVATQPISGPVHLVDTADSTISILNPF
jgi:cell division protein FtsQ